MRIGRAGAKAVQSIPGSGSDRFDDVGVVANGVRTPVQGVASQTSMGARVTATKRAAANTAAVMKAVLEGATSGKKRKGSTALPVESISEPAESAKAAGLRYVSDARPGLKRLKHGKSFRYTTAEGGSVRDAETLGRIKSLVIPPAWTDVWISPWTNGHLQATGRDVKGRKQSRYHPRWREVRDETKYERMSHFADALPTIRERVQHDLSLPGLPRKKVLATIVSLMEATLIRVGNEEYARENHSYGLTTMRNKHVEVHGSKITFTFQGKSRVHHTINLQDRRLAKIIERCEEIPGQELFHFLDHDGNAHTIDSADVNEYLREISGEHFTAKDFRTWAGSVLACMTLKELGPYETVTQAKKNVVEAIKSVAERLGNTPSVCRKCYVHPAVLEAYLGGTSVAKAKEQIEEEIEEHTTALKREELALLELLESRKLLAKAG